MTDLDRDSPIKLANGYRFQWEPAQDTHVLLYPEGLVKLNPTASLILSQINGERSLTQIIDVLSKQFPDVDVSADIESFIITAVENRWIAVS